MTNAAQLIRNNQYNIGHICTRQQCVAGLADKVAMRWVSPHLDRRDYTFADLDAESNRFANALQTLGLGKGDICFTFLPKMPEQFFALSGCFETAGIPIINTSLPQDLNRDKLSLIKGLMCNASASWWNGGLRTGKRNAA